jgi:hypothetical protein
MTLCSTCKHWLKEQSFLHGSTRFAPCALKPDKMVKDTRLISKTVEQNYRTSWTYTCPKHEPETEQ